MRWHLIVWVAGWMLLSACQPQALTEGNEGAARPLQHLPALSGDYFKLQSTTLNRPLHIYVRLPPGYEDSSDDYPVVYLLDGDSLFPILAANHMFLTYDDGLPEAIVVGIAYGSFDSDINHRGYDFTPDGPDAGEGRGGAAYFHRFLKDELIPEVETRYRADPARRVLFGQSLGGTLVLYSALTDPDLFWGRIASNPSFSVGREQFFSPGEPGTRNDLGLVLTSGSEDWPALREDALAWFDHGQSKASSAWSIHTITLEGGTHSADSPASYRAGMNWLFKRSD